MPSLGRALFSNQQEERPAGAFPSPSGAVSEKIDPPENRETAASIVAASSTSKPMAGLRKVCTLKGGRLTAFGQMHAAGREASTV